MKSLVIFLLLALMSASGLAQEPDKDNESFDTYLEIITELSSNEEEETDYNDMADQLYELWESPIQINDASPYDLARLFWLNEYQLNQLIAYIKKTSHWFPCTSWLIFRDLIPHLCKV